MIPIYKPFLEGNEKKYINECIDSTWISSQGRFLNDFEIAIKNYIGCNYASSCSNGTTALDLAFKAIDLKKGDEVITTSFTYVASTNSILINNGIPVFIDIEMKSWNIDTTSIENKITNKTKAILISNNYGYLPDITKLIDLCNKYGLYLIEDAAESFGASYGNIKSGRLGFISTFSFFGNKTITTGEGGMVLTDNKEIHEKIEKLKNQGNNNSIRYYHDILGYNYRMTNIQAAIGLAQVEQVDLILKKKREIYEFYYKHLKDVVIFQEPINENVQPSYWIIAVLFKSEEQKDNVTKAFLQNDIEFRPLFNPVDEFDFYKKNDSLIRTRSLFKNGICLPSFPALKNNELLKICNTIIKNI